MGGECRETAEEAFSEDQIQEMTNYLKERGLFAFVNEYVHSRNIPIRTLLLAFGLMLVSLFSHSSFLRLPR